MKIKELIAKLAIYDPEMEVFLYNTLDEGDAPALFVDEVGTHMYCKGDSCVREHLAEHPGTRVLLIHDNVYAVKEEDALGFYYSHLEFPNPDEDYEGD